MPISVKDANDNTVSVPLLSDYADGSGNLETHDQDLADVVATAALQGSLNASIGATTDAAATGNGSLVAVSKRIRDVLSGGVSVTGGLTDTQLRASAVPVTFSGTFAATQSGTWSVRNQDTSGNGLTSKAAGAERSLTVAVVDASGNHVTSFGGSGGTASNFGSVVPTAGTAAGFSDGTNLRAAKVVDLDTGAGTDWGQSVSLRLSASGGSVEAGTNANPLRTDPTGTTAQPISASSLPLPTGAASSTNLTGGGQKTQIVDSGGISITQTSGALDVNLKGGTALTDAQLRATPLPVTSSSRSVALTDRSGTAGTTAATTTAVANTSRVFLQIANPSLSATLWYNTTGPAVVNGGGSIPLAPGEQDIFDVICPTGAVSIVASVPSTPYTIKES